MVDEKRVVLEVGNAQEGAVSVLVILNVGSDVPLALWVTGNEVVGGHCVCHKQRVHESEFGRRHLIEHVSQCQWRKVGIIGAETDIHFNEEVAIALLYQVLISTNVLPFYSFVVIAGKGTMPKREHIVILRLKGCCREGKKDGKNSCFHIIFVL